MTQHLLVLCIFCLFPGVNTLTDTDAGVVAAGVISGLILIAIVIGVPVLIYLRNRKKQSRQKASLPNGIFVNGHAPKYAANGFPKKFHNGMAPPPRPPTAQPKSRKVYATPVGSYRGVPVVHVTPHGSRRGTPHGSRMATPLGSMRGPVRGGSARIILTSGRQPPMMHPMDPFGPRRPYPFRPRGRGMPYPGPYGYPNPTMYPYNFFPPPFPVYMDDMDDYDDDFDSEDERGSIRSTLRERKMREIDSEEERKIKEEERRKKKKVHQSRSRSRSKSPVERKRSKSPRRSRTPSPERYRTTTHQDLYTEVTRPQNRRSSSVSEGDAAAKIDEMFSFSSDASAKPGDVIFLPPGQHVDTSPRRLNSSTPRRDTTPPPKRGSSPKPWRDPSPDPKREAMSLPKDSTPPRPERKPTKIETTEYTYASVIRPAEEPGSSLSATIQNIVETGHTNVEHDLEKHKTEDIHYPPKEHSVSTGHILSRTSREYIPRRDDYGLATKRLASTAKPNLYGTDRYDSEDFRRPRTPPNDIPNDTPRESLIRRPPTPPNDIPLSSRSDRPSTPPFDGDDYRGRTSTQDLGVPPAPSVPLSQPQSNPIGSTQQVRAAFSNLVLEELKERHRIPEKEEDDDDSSRNRAVNFSASPPEIIPRSQPNSPRASLNLNPDKPPNDAAPPPPPPPPPPAPPLPI